MDWGKLLSQLVPLGISIAETIHPLNGSGAQKLSTATTFVQMGLGLATAAGAVPPGKATDVVAAINAAVSAANAAGGVPKIPHGPSTTPQ